MADYLDLIARLSDEDSKVRAKAAEVLGELKASEALPALIECLSDEYSAVRANAVEALGRLDATAAIPALIECLSDKDSVVRVKAAEVFGWFNASDRLLNASEVIPALLECLLDEDSGVRAKAADVLGQIKTSGVVPALIKCLSDEDSKVRAKAAEALGKLNASGTVPALIKCLSDEYSAVRANAAEALGWLKASAAIPALIKRLSDKDGWVRAKAADVLCQLKAIDSIPALIERLSDKDGWVRAKAAEALGELKALEALPALIECLSDEYSAVRANAAEALGELQVSEAIPALIDRLSDEDWCVRRNAAEALGELQASEAIPALIDRLSDECLWLWLNAADVLSKLEASEVVPALMVRLSDEDEWVRRNAAWSLGEIKASEAIPALIERLSDEDWWIRINAAEALGEIKASEAIPALIDRLSDDVIGIREKAAAALGKLNASEAVSALIKCLSDKSSLVRKNAAEALGKLNASEAVSALIKCLSDKSSLVRKNAAEALGNLNALESIPAFIALLQDKYEKVDVRCSVAQKLGVLKAKSAVPVLVSIWKDKLENDKIRTQVSQSLVLICIAVLQDKNESEKSRSIAVKALGSLKAKSSVPVLVSIWKDKLENNAIRTQVFQSLVLICIAVLQDKNESDNSRCAAIANLGVLNAQSAIPILRTTLQDKQEQEAIHVAVVQTLSKLKAKVTIPVIQEALHNSSLQIKKASAKALTELSAEKDKNLDNNKKIITENLHIKPLGFVENSSSEVLEEEKFLIVTSVQSIREAVSISYLPKEGDGVYAERNGKRKSIQLSKVLASGGEGTVFTTNIPNIVAKIYNPKKIDSNKYKKIKQMLAKKLEYEGICFPLAFVYNSNNEFVGYLMSKAQGTELQKSLFIPALLKKKFPHWKKTDTVQLCVTILRKLKYLHDRNIILGDINPNNILVVSPDEVYFVDTDSYQVEGFPCPVGTTNFTAPEIQGKQYHAFLRSMGNEHFAVATLLFMIMLPGKPPYSIQGGENQVENIKNGNFAYPSGERSTGQAPAGQWRYIWSHLPRYLKDDFYETFRKGGKYSTEQTRRSTDNWLKSFEYYLYLLTSGKFIEQDEMSIELFPTRFKKNNKLTYVKCSLCNKDVDKNKAKQEFCPDCWVKEKSRLYEKRKCLLCGEAFEITYGEKEFYESKEFSFPKKCSSCRANKFIAHSRAKY